MKAQTGTAADAEDPLESISIDLFDDDGPADAAAAPAEAPPAAVPTGDEVGALPELDLSAVSAASTHPADEGALPELDLHAVSAEHAGQDDALPEFDLSAVSAAPAADAAPFPRIDLPDFSAAPTADQAPLPELDLPAISAAPAAPAFGDDEALPDFDLSAIAAAAPYAPPPTPSSAAPVPAAVPASDAEPLPDFDLSAISAAAPAPAAAPQAAPHNPDAPWPGNTPTVEMALECLRGDTPAPEAFAAARKVQDTMTQPDREAVRVEGLSPALRDGMVMRWRLAAALDLLPAAQGTVDQAALDAMLAEVDRTLTTLREAVSTTPELALAVDRACERLTTEALTFSNRVKAAPAAAPAAPTATAAKRAAASTGKVTFQANSKADAPDRRSKAMYAVLAVVLLVAGGYHASKLLEPPPPAPPTVAGAPLNTTVISDPSTGVMRVMTTAPGGVVTPEQKAWLQQQEAKGMLVKELGPGSFLVAPAPTPKPATAGPVTP